MRNFLLVVACVPPLSGCVVGTVAKTAVDVATLPVKVVSAGVDAATTSQKAVTSGATANGTANGSSVLKRFGKSKEEPQDVPAAPQTKVVRQQPVRQTRSKRGNAGKR